MICGIVRMTLIKTLNSTTDSSCKCFIDFLRSDRSQRNTIGTKVPLASWSFAEFSVAMVAGSIPPCRALVLQTLHKFRGEAPSDENLVDRPNNRFGHNFPLNIFPKITNASSRSQGSAKGPLDSERKYMSASLWNRKATRAGSLDSGREHILPLHKVVKPSSETGVQLIVEVTVGTGEDDTGFAAEHYPARVKEDVGRG